MKVNPKVYYTRLGSTINSTEFMKAIYKIVTNSSNPLSHWVYESHTSDFTEIVLKCRAQVEPGKNMRLKIKRTITIPTGTANVGYGVGQLSIDGINWSPESKMIGAHIHQENNQYSQASFTNRYKLKANSKIYLVEVEDAIFVYTNDVLNSTGNGNAAYSNNLGYSLSAGVLFQPQDFSSSFNKGYAIFGGFPAAFQRYGSLSITARAGEPYVVPSLMVDRRSQANRSSFALFDNEWIKIKSKTHSAENPNYAFGDNYSTESLIGMNLYQATDPNTSTTSGIVAHSGPFIGITKYMRIVNNTETNNSILNYATNVGWRKNNILDVFSNRLALIWCKSVADEIDIL